MSVKSIIKAPFRLAVKRSPEVLLALFLICLLPLVVMAARQIFYLIWGAFSDFDTFISLIREDYPAYLAGALCVVGGILLLFFTIKCRRNIWAVARKMILEALNRKVVLILLLFFVILMPSLPFILQTEGSLVSQVQIVITYSLALAEVLLSVMAIFICTASVCSEITKKQVYMTDTKPLGRWQFLFGKLMGVTILCGVLLFVMSGAVFGIVNYMARRPSREGLSREEAMDKQREWRRVREEVMVARNTVTPSIPDTGEYVERRLEERKSRGEITTPAQEAEAKRQLEAEAIRRTSTAEANGLARFTFRGLDPQSGRPLYLRAKPHLTTPEDDHLCPGAWIFVRPPGGEGEAGYMRPIGSYPQQLTPGAFQEIAIDPSVIDRNGVLRVVYENQCSHTGVQFSHEGGIEVMQKVGGFTPNYYRSVLVVLAHIVLLAALSIMLGAMFSFPVASFCVVSVLVIGLLGPWVAEHALEVPAGSEMSAIGIWASEALFTALRGILSVLPQFGRFSPIERVAGGRLISLGYAARATAVMVFLQGGVAMLLATYFFWRRELARIIV